MHKSYHSAIMSVTKHAIQFPEKSVMTEINFWTGMHKTGI